MGGKTRGVGGEKWGIFSLERERKFKLEKQKELFDILFKDQHFTFYPEILQYVAVTLP